MNSKKILATVVEEIVQQKPSCTYRALEEKYHVNVYYLWKIVNQPDYIPPARVLQLLGVAAPARVLALGVVTPGAQVLESKTCPCGRAFIPNHPRRRRCYTCSAVRSKA